MGVLRLLLALSVLVSHSEPLFGLKFTSGQISVQTFYIISGFYMSLVLNEKYLNKIGGYRLFLSNRILRLYPIYWIVLFLSITFFAVYGLASSNYLDLTSYIENGSKLNFFSLTFLIFSNIFIIGQDAVMFLGVDQNGMLEFVKDYSKTSPMLHSFLILPQAWTIGLEITFYLIAPFIVRRKLWVIIALISLSLVLRLFFYSYGYKHDPWLYRFLPFELAFFLVGICSYRLYQFISKKMYLKGLGKLL